jgi:hypothetical protein
MSGSRGLAVGPVKGRLISLLGRIPSGRAWSLSNPITVHQKYNSGENHKTSYNASNNTANGCFLLGRGLARKRPDFHAGRGSAGIA